MCHEHRISHKVQKLRQNRLDGLCLHHHAVIDAGQFLDFKRNRHFRVDKDRKAVYNLSLVHLHGANLYNAVCNWRKSGCLDIKYHKRTIKPLPFVTGHNLLEVIDQIALHAVDHLKVISMV